jgi:peptidoglycan/LPS O-acetylase OafA/YrhL
MSTSGKFKHLDGLRGFAALIVVIHHYACFFYPAVIFGFVGVTTHSRVEKYIYGTPIDLVVAGNFSVCIFFVLSGFVLSHKFFRTRDIEVVISSASRRYIRLGIPVFFAVMFGYLLLQTHAFTNLKLASTTGSTMWLGEMWNFPANFFHALKQALYDVLWTMKFEFLGSFLVFLFLALFGNLRRRWIFYIIFGLIFWKTYYLAFILGVGLSDYIANKPFAPEVTKRSQIGLFLVLGLGFIFGSFPLPSATPALYSKLYLISGLTYADYFIISHVLGAFFILVAVIRIQLLERIFASQICQFLGRISFSLYLLHMFVLGTYSTRLFALLYPRFSYSTAVIGTLIPSIIIIFIISDIFARYVDETAISHSAKAYRKLISTRGSHKNTAPAIQTESSKLFKEPLSSELG